MYSISKLPSICKLYIIILFDVYMRYIHKKSVIFPSKLKKYFQDFKGFFFQHLKRLPGQSCSVQFQTPPTQTLNKIIKILA